MDRAIRWAAGLYRTDSVPMGNGIWRRFVMHATQEAPVRVAAPLTPAARHRSPRRHSRASVERCRARAGGWFL